MQCQYHIIAAVLILAVTIQQGWAISCVVCNSFRNPDCDSNLDKYKEECVGEFANATSCRKMEQEIYYDDDYQIRTVRQCAISKAPTGCIERTGTYRFKIYYCHCNEDYCNSAGTASVSLFVASLAAFAAYFLKL